MQNSKYLTYSLGISATRNVCTRVFVYLFDYGFRCVAPRRIMPVSILLVCMLTCFSGSCIKLYDMRVCGGATAMPSHTVAALPVTCTPVAWVEMLEEQEG